MNSLRSNSYDEDSLVDTDNEIGVNDVHQIPNNSTINIGKIEVTDSEEVEDLSPREQDIVCNENRNIFFMKKNVESVVPSCHKRRREKLQRELLDLDSTVFPGDANYSEHGPHHTTAVEDPNDVSSNDSIISDHGDENPDDIRDGFTDAIEGEGEDLLENIFDDYQPIDALDTYGSEGIDNTDYGPIDSDARAAAEKIISERENAERRKLDRNKTFYDTLYADDEGEEKRQERRNQFRREDKDEVDLAERDEEKIEDDDELLEMNEEVNLEAFNVPLKEWVAQDRTRIAVQRKFRRFLIKFKDNVNSKTSLYEDKIRTMCSSNLATLEISYLHLMEMEPIVAIWLADVPQDLLEVINEAATRHTVRLFPSYLSIQDEIFVRITDMPILDSLRSLRRSHLDHLVRVHGVVIRRSSIYPQLKLAFYGCAKCNHLLGPYRVPETSSESNGNAAIHQPGSCPSCDSEGPFKLNLQRTKYRNYQRLNLQETPGSVLPGRVPRSKEIILTNDLIDTARPGEDVEVTGIYSHTYDYHLTQKNGFPIFRTYISANNIRRKEDDSSVSNLSEQDKNQILELARDPNIGQRIVSSIAPSIHGHHHVKMALAMSLFGAVPKNISDKHRIRGDINVLLLGDPGTAKSQMLKYAEATAPRAVYSTGKGASAVGLTASVHKDPMTREWTLEGGALVLADRGLCLIDEFDKMNEQDRTSIHEAMEQQSISVSKAGIVTSLQARCAVIAAANPIGGRYDSSCTLSENVELTDPILQRFDVLCVLQDTIDPVADERLARFVTDSHICSIPTNDVIRGIASLPDYPTENKINDPKLIPQELLRKYIQYARTNVSPVLSGNSVDQEKIASLYVDLRRESMSSGGIPVAVRHIESIMRMAEAHAKIHLRDYVRDDDVNASINMMLESFVMAQKFSVRRQLRRSFSKYISSGEDRVHLLLHILQDMMRNEAMYQTIRMRQRGEEKASLGNLEVTIEEFESRARDRRIYDISDFCVGEQFRNSGYVLNRKSGVISRDGQYN